MTVEIPVHPVCPSVQSQVRARGTLGVTQLSYKHKPNVYNNVQAITQTLATLMSAENRFFKLVSYIALNNNILFRSVI